MGTGRLGARHCALKSGGAVFLCGLLFLTLTPGCGLNNVQKEGIRSFGKAASAMGTATSATFPALRENVIRMKTVRHAIEGTKLPATKPDGKPADRGFYAEELNLDSGLDPDNLGTRLKATEMLVAYGDLLQALSETSRETEIAEATDRFMGSIRRFPGNSLSEEQIGGLGKLLAAAGGLWVEREKKRAVGKVVPAVSPMLEALCDSLERDFDVANDGIARDVAIVQDRLASESIEGLKREPEGIADRMILVEGFALADESKARLESMAGGALKAIAALRTANRDLVRVVAEESFSLETIRSCTKDVNELVKAVKPFVKRQGG